MPGNPRLKLGCILLRHVFGDVGHRPHRHKQALAIGREHQIAREVTAAAIGEQLGHNHLGHAAGDHITRLVGIAHYAVGFGDIQPLRVAARGVQRHTKRLHQALCKHADLVGLAAIGRRPQYRDLAFLCLRQQHIAVGRNTHGTRARQVAGEHIHLKACRHLQFGIGRLVDELGEVAGRGAFKRRRQLGHVDAMTAAGRVLLPIGLALGRTGCSSRRRTEALRRRRIFKSAGLHSLKVSHHVGALGAVGDGHHHGRTRHHRRGRSQETFERCGIPHQVRTRQCLGIAEGRAIAGLATDDTDQRRALRAAAIIGLGAVAERALLTEHSLACSRIRSHSCKRCEQQC